MNVYNIAENKIPPREFQIIIKPGKIITKDEVSEPEKYTAYLIHEIGMVYAGEAKTVEEVKDIAFKFLTKEFAGKGEPVKLEDVEFSEQQAEPSKTGRKK